MDQLRVEISAPDLSRHIGESRLSFVEYKKEQIEQSIPSRFERQVDLYKDCPAVKYGSEILSYDKLNKQANRLARAIVSIRGIDTEAVALMLPQGPELIAAVLAVLKIKITYFHDNTHLYSLKMTIYACVFLYEPYQLLK